MIEGLGTNMGNIFPVWEQSTYLICAFKDSVADYHGVDPQYYFGSCSYFTVDREVEKPTESQLMVYPNPVDSEVNIALPTHSEMYSIQIMDQQGRIMQIEEITFKKKILVDDLPAGLYRMRVTAKNGKSWFGKFLKD